MTAPTTSRRTIGLALLATAAVAASLAAAASAIDHAWFRYELPGSIPAALAFGLAAVGLGTASILAVLAAPTDGGARTEAGAVSLLALSWAAVAALVTPGTPPLVRAVAMTLGALAAPSLLLITSGHAAPPSRLRRRVTAAAAGLCGLLGLLRALTTDPFLDPGCRIDCTAPPILLIHSVPASQVIGSALQIASAMIAMVAAASALTSIRTANRRGLLVATAVAAIAQVTATAAPGSRPIVGPAPPGLGEPLFLVRSLTLALVAAAVLAWSLQLFRRTARLRAAFDSLAADPGDVLRTVLSQALRDPDLTVAYWLPSLGHWADLEGTPLNLPADSGFTIVRDGRPLAHVSLSTPVPDASETARVIGAASLLMVDNERLRVELRAQSHALRESRRRIVAAADEARRQIERELHDGAQQRLLAASASLRLALEDPSATDDAGRLQQQLDGVLELLARLREISRGVYPPTLAASGLVAGLESLARTCPTPLSLYAQGLPRLGEAAEFTAYLAVHEAVTAATSNQAVATLSRSDGMLRVDLAGVPGFRLDRLADRVGAIGGTIEQDQDRVRLEVPCAS